MPFEEYSFSMIAAPRSQFEAEGIDTFVCVGWKKWRKTKLSDALFVCE